MKFLDFMITKDNPGEVIDDEILKDRILYIPRVNSGNGKKRGAILSWALPANRMWDTKSSLVLSSFSNNHTSLFLF